eukprot:snap_masked-scaffold_9-processed-gene-13.51-mRNA-1 protein AED:1.00 eAED:1.00 QI:0/-1/0/0/-1/1/1/0/144
MDKRHPSLAAEKKSIPKVYFHGILQSELSGQLNSLWKRCLHYHRELPILRRPYNLTHLTKRCREILRADYLYVNKIGDILSIMDSVAKELILFYSKVPTATVISDALLQWRSDIGFTDYFLAITDNGPHFSNYLLKALSKNTGL